MVKRIGMSYRKRVHDVVALYDEKARIGLSNREIWRRYIYPRFAISERTMYSMLRASAEERNEIPPSAQQFFDFDGFGPDTRHGTAERR